MLLGFVLCVCTVFADQPQIPVCTVQYPAPQIQAAIKNKRLLFIGESHTNSPKPISQAKIFDQLCGLNRPVILLTEFIWPSWQANLNRFLNTPTANDFQAAQEFIVRNVGTSSMQKAQQQYADRFAEFLVWAKQTSLPMVGIDADNFGDQRPHVAHTQVPAALLQTVIQEFKISDHMLDPVTYRDMNMATQILRVHRLMPPEALIVVYAGSLHTSRLPTLLAEAGVALPQMLSLYMGYGTGPMTRAQLVLKATSSAPDTLFLAPFDDIKGMQKYALALQKIIYQSGVFAKYLAPASQ